MIARVSPSRGNVRPSAQKPKTQQSYSWPAPVRGLIANGNIAAPVPGGAFILDNFRCTAQGAVMRRGKDEYATVGSDSLAIRTLFSYLGGGASKFFAANDDGIYDITVTPTLKWANTSGDWIVTQTQSSTGTTYLIGVNGTDPSFVYDGTTFAPQVDGGVSTLAFDAKTADFTVGSTLTGGTSGATATIQSIGAASLQISDISGTFQDNETITDDEGGSATADGVPLVIPATDLSFPDGVELTSADLVFVWSYKNRLFFIEKESLNVWYLKAGEIAGELTKIPFGGLFSLGGDLVMGATWSRDTGSGLNAMCAFFSSQGQVAIYDGDNPNSAQTWKLQNVYTIGKPMGKRATIDAGGDLLCSTDVGLVQLSSALTVDLAVLGQNAVSADILDLWNREVGLRSDDWNVAFLSSKQMIAVALPPTAGQPSKWLVVNAQTKGWSTYSGWDATCVHVYDNFIYFGTSDGKVFQAEASGQDDGEQYSATYVPMFDQMGAVGYKLVSMLRAVFRGPVPVIEKVRDLSDYDETIPPAPDASPVSSSSVWGSVVVGESFWAATTTQKSVFQRWHAAYGGGEVHAPCVQLTSSSIKPLDTEIVRVDATFTQGQVVV